MFSSSQFRPEYYEDVYGETKPDEDFDRFPDECEEESSSDDDQMKSLESPSTSEGFLSRLHTPKRKRSPTKLETGNNTFNFIRPSPISPLRNKKSPKYRISPSQSPRNSISVDPKKKITPHKGGLFNSSFTAMDFDTSTPNSAGEMMEDMFRAGADEAIDIDHDYVSEPFMSELREYAAMEPQIDPALLKEDEERRGEEKEQEDATRGGEKATAEPNLRPFKPFRATTTVANTKAKMDKTTATTLPARTSKRTTKSQPATRPLSATTRTKPAPTRVTKMSDTQVRGNIGGRSARVRKWKGDVMNGLGDGRGIVVVYSNETDPAGYERFGD